MNDGTHTSIDLREPVSALVAREPGYARILETFEIEYCCTGEMTLEEAARDHGLNPDNLAETMESALAERRSVGPGADGVIANHDLSLRDLIAQIASRYHRSLRKELPRLINLTGRVATAHGTDDVRLHVVADRTQVIAETLLRHIETEENHLFPLLRAGESLYDGNGEALMERLRYNHLTVETALIVVRTLTDEYQPPEDACNTYRATMSSLQELDQDWSAYARLEREELFLRSTSA